jgi:hypothetical protein
MSNELDPVALAGGSNPNITTLHPLKRFAKGLILLQSAHFSTLRPTASASQHVAGFAGRLVSISAVCRRAAGSIISRSAVTLYARKASDPIAKG